MSVAFSVDNRQIVSGSRDKTIKLWNTLAECKYTIQDDGHTDWVSCVRFSPNHANPIIVSAGWDRVVKVKIEKCIKKEKHVGVKCTCYNDEIFCNIHDRSNGRSDGCLRIWD